MSRMTYLNPIETSADMITAFSGYNHNLSISDGEFYDMENLSSDRFPLVSIRGKRVKVPKKYTFATPPPQDISQWSDMDMSEWYITENDGLYAIRFKVNQYYGGNHNYNIDILKFNETTKVWDVEYRTTAMDFKIQGVTVDYTLNMGAQIVAFPAKFVYNTVKKELKLLESSYTTTINNALRLQTVDHNGDSISSWTSSKTEPTEPTNGQYWLDTSNKDYVLKRYSEASGMWANVQVYAKMRLYDAQHSTTVGTNNETFVSLFEEGDAIELPFVKNGCTVIKAAEGQKTWVIYKKVSGDSGYLMIPIIPAGSHNCTHYPTDIKRTVPTFDYITESNNRLWACRYGDDGSGETVNEIFACKLGDPTNWHYFSNTSVDSYYLSLGVGGRFTAAVTYQSTPIFFKEDSIHRIYGNFPANYQLKSVTGYGVQAGSDKSVKELNDTVYYLSNSGIAAYRGATPVTIGERFGVDRFKEGIAASAGNKYYISMKTGNDRILFAYDDRYGTWYKEGILPVADMFTYNTKIFCKQTDELLCLSEFAGIDSYEDKVSWWMDFGKIGFNTPFHKFVTKVVFRLRLKSNTQASVFIQYDSDGNWNHITDLRPRGIAEAMTVPITPHRCDHFNIKLKGAGEAELISVTKFYEESNDYD